MKTDIELSSLAEKCRVYFREDNTSPIDIFAMVSGIPNLTIVFYPFSENISGMCIKSKSSVIAINSKMTYGRQRFTVAHELYHLFYDNSETLAVCAKSFDTPNRNDVEIEADIFASYLLAPYTALISFIEQEELDPENDPSATVRLEQHFQISRQAAMLRLRKQGYVYSPSTEIRLSKKVISYAAGLGYDRKLYEPYNKDNKYLTIGAYLEQAKRLHDNRRISKGKYEEYLIDAFRSDLLLNDSEEELYD